MTNEQHFYDLISQCLPANWVEPAQAKRLAEYLALLAKWSRHYNLTAIRDPLKMVSHHLLDSLAITDVVTAKQVLDLGCGAGLPGIPLAIVRPEQSFVLLDSVGKKTRFCQQVKMTLGLDNVEVVQVRAEDWRVANGFDMIVTRAFSAVDEMLILAQHLLCEKGVFLAMKGKLHQSELAALPTGWCVDCQHLDVPRLNEQRHLLRVYRC